MLIGVPAESKSNSNGKVLQCENDMDSCLVMGLPSALGHREWEPSVRIPGRQFSTFVCEIPPSLPVFLLPSYLSLLPKPSLISEPTLERAIPVNFPSLPPSPFSPEGVTSSWIS